LTFISLAFSLFVASYPIIPYSPFNTLLFFRPSFCCSFFPRYFLFFIIHSATNICLSGSLSACSLSIAVYPTLPHAFLFFPLSVTTHVFFFISLLFFPSFVFVFPYLSLMGERKTSFPHFSLHKKIGSLTTPYARSVLPSLCTSCLGSFQQGFAHLPLHTPLHLPYHFLS
jgi:hypothetical protein